MDANKLGFFVDGKWQTINIPYIRIRHGFGVVNNLESVDPFEGSAGGWSRSLKMFHGRSKHGNYIPWRIRMYGIFMVCHFQQKKKRFVSINLPLTYGSVMGMVYGYYLWSSKSSVAMVGWPSPNPLGKPGPMCWPWHKWYKLRWGPPQVCSFINPWRLDNEENSPINPRVHQGYKSTIVNLYTYSI